MTNIGQRLLYAALAQNFNMFLEKCYYEIDGGETYTETIATKLIIDRLHRVSSDNINRLVINAPPRSLKTKIVSVAYTAWLLGHNPKLKIMCISYGDNLATDFSLYTRQIMQSDWYKNTFPKTRLKKGRQQDSFFETTQNGFRKAASMQGGITGHGADIIIIDDPQKAQEILSDNKRKSSNEIFSSTIISRFNNSNKGKIIVVAQRLHEDDFSNYVQKFGKWDVLSIPAIAETDETYTLSDGTILLRRAKDVINPDLQSLESLEEIKIGMGEFNFSAQFQQQPIPAKGNIINFDDFQFYNSLPVTSKGVIMQSWDVAAKTGENNDYSVCVTAAVINNVTYIIDISRYKVDFTDLLAKIKEMKQLYGAQRIIIEDIGIGTSLINYLKREGLIILPYCPTLSKADRAAAKTYLVRSGNVLLPQNAGWLDSFKAEVLAFPYGKHDDQVDSLIQLLDEIEKSQNNCSIEDITEAMKNRKPEICQNPIWQAALSKLKNKPRGWKPPF